MKFTALAFATIVVPAFAQTHREVDVRALEPAPTLEQAAAPSTFSRNERKAATLLAIQAGELKPGGEAADLTGTSNTSVRIAQSKTAATVEFPALAAPPQEATAAKPPPAHAPQKPKALGNPSVRKASRAASAATK